MPTLAFGDMNSMIVLDANDEYRSYMLENVDLKLLRMFLLWLVSAVLLGRQC